MLQEFNSALDAALVAKKSLINDIGTLPDNHKIRHRYTDKCFTIMSSDLDGNLAPQHHDFKLQYRLLQGLVLVTPLERIQPVLTKVVFTGKLPIKISGYDRGFKFHQIVIANLKSLICIDV